MKTNLYNIAIILIVIAVIFVFGVNIFLIVSKKIETDRVQEPVKQVEEKTEEILSIENTDIIGYLKIESINLYAPIKDGTDLKVLKEAIGHFKESSYFSGNICFAAHNRGYNQNFFENLKYVKDGDEITYITKYAEQKYYVSEIKEVEETDLSILNPTENNQLTLITCIANKKEKRLCVIATETEMNN